MRGQAARHANQFFFLLLQRFVRDTAFTVALHEFGQSRARFVFQEIRRKLELDSLTEKFDHLRLTGPLQLMSFLMLDLMLERAPQIMQRFVRHPFRGEGVIERRQDALLDFMQRNHVLGGLARNFRDRKIRWEFHP